MHFNRVEGTSPASRFPSSIRVYAALILLSIPVLCFATQAVAEKVMDLPMEPVQNYFREHCLVLDAGQTLVYRMETPYPLNFNIHHHPETGPTVYLIRKSIEEYFSGESVADAGGEYCFMWTNPEDRPEKFSVNLKYKVSSD